MHEPNATIFDLERQISVVGACIKQQQLLIGGLQGTSERIEALSTYAELLRAEYELDCYRDQLKRRLSAHLLYVVNAEGDARELGLIPTANSARGVAG
jgi:hypothetical protein